MLNLKAASLPKKSPPDVPGPPSLERHRVGVPRFVVMEASHGVNRFGVARLDGRTRDGTFTILVSGLRTRKEAEADIKRRQKTARPEQIEASNKFISVTADLKLVARLQAARKECP